MTIQEFCDKHDACAEGKEWALEHCKDMHEVWLTCKTEWFIWVATREGVLSDRDLRLFSLWCCRKIWHSFTDERPQNAVIVAKRYANGEATYAELVLALSAAWDTESDAEKAAQVKYLRDKFNPFKN